MTPELIKGELRKTDKGFFYRINGLDLPLLPVTSDTCIAYFNPLEPANHEFGANSLSDILSDLIEQEQKPLTVITPPSEKSHSMVEAAVNRTRGRHNPEQVTLYFILGGTQEQYFPSPYEHFVRYSPITQKNKIVAVNRELARQLKAELSNGSQLVFVDDVISSRKTVEAVHMLLQQAGITNESTPVISVAVAVEGDIPPDVHYAIHLPIFKNLNTIPQGFSGWTVNGWKPGPLGYRVGH